MKKNKNKKVKPKNTGFVCPNCGSVSMFSISNTTNCSNCFFNYPIFYFDIK